jgi:hypothetical protein
VAAVDGLVLCTAGGARVAVSTDEVDTISAVEGRTWDAALAFGLVAGEGEGRALQVLGRLIRFDSIDVLATPGLEVMPAPLLVVNAAHGAIRGFVNVAGALWPLITLDRFLAHLEARAR